MNDQDQALIGYEMGSTSTALGIPNFNQAFRVLSRQLAKLTEGNQFIQFETSFRAMKLRPGDIITATYLKEGLARIPFRVTKLTPSVNFRRVQIVAQYHNDNWYSDNPGIGGGTGRQPGTGISLPRPLLGTSLSDGLTRFDVQEQTRIQTDGSASTTLRVQFAEPSKPALNGPNLPLLSLSPAISTTGGTLSSGNYYYAIAANDQSGNEGMLSFVVTAAVPNTTSTNAVTLAKLSFPATAASFNVYRGGEKPQRLYRIASNQVLSTSFGRWICRLAGGAARPEFRSRQFLLSPGVRGADPG